jgi:aspartyl-tRNA(Asn)/glutamyl-tRNA(Gln) amidotransferase subunit A
MTDLADLSASQLSEAFRHKRLSPVEVAQAVFDRIAQCESSINAMYRIHNEAGMAAARAAQSRWMRGEPLSPIDGVPVTLKENLYTAGDPAPIGVPTGDLSPRTADSPVAARLREAGAVILGKTTMPDFGMMSSGLSSMHGTTRNPWRLDLNPAGSSSGAGAAGAAGYGPLHVGTDIGGSVRLPANHCGLFGLKPSMGRIPIDPPFTGRVAGPMTRTVADAALLMDQITRPDERDWMSLPYQPIGFAAGLEGLAARGLRIGLLTDMGCGLAPQAAVCDNARSAAAALQAAGAIVEPMSSYLTAEMLDGVCRFFEARSSGDVRQMSAEQRARVLPYILEWATWRADAFSGHDVMSGYGQLMAMREAIVRAVSRFDFVVSPVAPVVSYPADAHSPTDDPHRALEHIAFTVACNMSEQPAASVNWGYDRDGLPIGVQVIGQRFDDLGVMRLCRLLETLRPEQRPWPVL